MKFSHFATLAVVGLSLVACGNNAIPASANTASAQPSQAAVSGDQASTLRHSSDSQANVFAYMFSDASSSDVAGDASDDVTLSGIASPPAALGITDGEPCGMRIVACETNFVEDGKLLKQLLNHNVRFKAPKSACRDEVRSFLEKLCKVTSGANAARAKIIKFSKLVPRDDVPAKEQSQPQSAPSSGLNENFEGKILMRSAGENGETKSMVVSVDGKSIDVDLSALKGLALLKNLQSGDVVNFKGVLKKDANNMDKIDAVQLKLK